MKYTDQLNNTIELSARPKRIISLIPSQTEYLWDLGLKDQIIGISKFCIHPKEMYESKTRVGGTKLLDIEKIKQLKPDLIIGNKEENVKAQIEELQNFFPVWMSDVNTLEDAFEMMLQLGIVCGKSHESEILVDQIKCELKKVKGLFHFKSVAYFIWKDPYLVVGSNTFIESVLSYIGFNNVFKNISRYPEISLAQLAFAKPQYCFLSSEPFPFNEKHLQELAHLMPETTVVLVNGEMFSWYGSHLVNLPSYLFNLKKGLR